MHIFDIEYTLYSFEYIQGICQIYKYLYQIKHRHISTTLLICVLKYFIHSDLPVWEAW